MRLARTSLLLMMVQLALVSTIAAKYAYQRWSAPRVWTRAVAVDPETLMRGRYLSLRLMMNACGNELPQPSANPGTVIYRGGLPTYFDASFPVRLRVAHNRLEAVRLAENEGVHAANHAYVPLDATCANVPLEEPVDFYLSEKAADPSRLQPGQELWIEVTVPSQGPPRPLQLATKDHGVWKPLALK